VLAARALGGLLLGAIAHARTTRRVPARAAEQVVEPGDQVARDAPSRLGAVSA
jgi:hypothetical protein